MESSAVNSETSVVSYFRDIFPRVNQALREALLVEKLIKPAQRVSYLENTYGIRIEISKSTNLFDAVLSGKYEITDKNKFIFFMLKFYSEPNSLTVSKD